MRIVPKIPYDDDGNMVLWTGMGKKDSFVYRVNGPVKATFTIKNWGSTNKQQYVVLEDQSGRIYYMFFEDFIKVVFNKQIVNRQFSGIWIGHGYSATYGLRMHETDPDCPEEYDNWRPLK
jgi:hypothetical protein